MAASLKTIEPELYQKIRKFVIDCTAFMSKVYGSDFDPLIGSPVTENEEIPPYIFVKEERIIQLLYRQYEKLSEFASYKELIKYFKRKCWHPSEIRDFLQYYYSIMKGFCFDAKVFDSLYSKFERYKLSQKRRELFWCLLENFSSDVQEMILGDNLKIRRITNQEVRRIREEASATSLAIGGPLGYVIERLLEYDEQEILNKPTKLDWKKIEELENEKREINSLFKRVVSALRLFKGEYLGCPMEYLSIHLDWGVGHGGLSIQYGLFAPHFNRGGPLNLNKSEAQEFIEFWNDFEGKSHSGRVKVAIERFNYLHQRKNPEDNIIDCMIALEALFETDERKRTLVPLKAAFLLGNNKQEVQMIFELLKETYELRSKVVHGNEVRFPREILSKKYLKFGDFVSEVQELVRRSIKTYLGDKIAKEKEDIFKLIELLEVKGGKEIIDRVFDFTPNK